MSAYTPNEREIRDACAGIIRTEHFDRFIAQTRADAWDQGCGAFERAWEWDNRNPYEWLSENPHIEKGADE